MQPSCTLNEADVRIIVNQLIENFNELPKSINIDNIVVHDQSKLKVWAINFASHQRNESIIQRSIASIIIELLISRQKAYYTTNLNNSQEED